MTTKPPPAVAEFPLDSLEKLAYGTVSDVETVEPNDRNRLGYCIWAWLKERSGTLDEAILNSGSRTKLPLKEIAELVRRRLQENGVAV